MVQFPSPSDPSTAERHRPALAVLLLVAAAALGACGERGASGVPAGEWEGDLALPNSPYRWGVSWQLTRPDSLDGPTLSLSTPSRGHTDPVPVRVAGDTLRFPLPFRSTWNCRAVHRSDGTWSGACEPEGDGGKAGILMVPPGRDVPVGAVRMALDSIDASWDTIRTEGAVLYTRPGTEAARNLERLRWDARKAVRNAVETLDAPDWDGPVRLVYLDSQQEMKRVVGRPVRGWADAGGNGILLVTDDRGGTPVRHEMIHVVSFRRWGTATRPGAWIQEGLAEWATGGTCGRVSHGRLDLYLDRRGDSLSLSMLTNEFWQHSDRITIPKATTLVEYLVEEHGFGAMRKIWERGVGASEQVLGLPPDSVDRHWRTFVRDRYRPATDSLWQTSMGRENGCPFPTDD